MRVVVTGGTGFVGSHAARSLMARGHHVRLLVRSEEKMRRVFGDDAPRDFVVGDVTDAGAVERALEGMHGVVHSAAAVSIEGSRAAEVLATNARGTELVLGGAARAGALSIVYVSSLTAILDPEAPAIHGHSPVVSAQSAYGRSKAEAEEYARRLRAEGAPVSILYPSGVLGPGDPGLAESMRGLVALLTSCIFRTTGGWMAVDVRDLANAVATTFEAASPGGYVTAGHFFPWDEFGDLMDEITGRPVRRIPVPAPLLRGIGAAGDLLKKVVPFDYPMTREAMEMVTLMRPVPNTPELEAMGVRFRDPHETYQDTLRALLEAGHLPPHVAPKLAREVDSAA